MVLHEPLTVQLILALCGVAVGILKRFEVGGRLAA